MKTRYTKSQIVDAISFWHNELLRESLEPKTEAKLKEAAKVFAKAIGAQIKAGGMFRFEDGETPDPLVAIKTTIKKGVSIDNCKKELKKLGMPAEVIDQMAKGYSEWFSKNIFGGDKKAIDNLLKTTEQFNYFANVVFGVWHHDPVLSKLLKKNPPKAGEDKESASSEDTSLNEDDVSLDEGWRIPQPWVAVVKVKNGDYVDFIVYATSEEEAKKKGEDIIKTHKLPDAIVVSAHEKDWDKIETSDDESEWFVNEGESFRANGNEDATINEDDDLNEVTATEDNNIVIYTSKWVAWYGTSDDLNAQEHDVRIKNLQSDWVNSKEFNEKDGDHLEKMIKFAEDQGFHVTSIGLPYSGKLVSVDDFLKNSSTGINERYDRYGGFGGYGRKYSSYGSNAPRGAAIGWYCVADVDPACKNMDRNWRFGPIEFTRGVVDFLYPERQYKRGATMLRHKHFKMPNDGDVVELYVGIASIFDAVKNNDEEALKKLDMIGINRNISLGLDPEDDYSAQYVLR